MSTATDRRFIARRTGLTVTIREITPGSCAFDFSREEAWAHAQREARPAKRAAGKDRQQPAQIVFQGLDGMSTVVQTAQATQDAYEKVGIQQIATTPAQQAPAPAPIADAPRVAEYEWLKAQDTTGNDFLTSLKDQLEKRGTLSDKQRECVTRAMAKREAPKGDTCPDGRYAVEYNGKLRFYKVNSPKQGRWAGFTFVNVMASDEEYPVKGQSRTEIIALIAADPQAAMARYGQEIGKCGRCNRTLTDEDSRAKGIGPECEKMI